MEVRKKSLVVLLGVAVAGIVGASAASLGLTSSSVGADTAVVAACDTTGGIQASYTTGYDTVTQQFTVTGVTLSGVDSACAGKAVSIRLTSSTPAAVLATVTGTAASGTNSFAVTPAVSAKALDGIQVLISG